MIRSKIASRCKRATTMGFLWALLALVLHVFPGAVAPAHAQGSRKDDIVFNSRGIPLAGATVRVCAMPASGQPCTPLALIYSDAALTQALANPTTTDGLGNYFFYAAPGKYEIEISGPGITTKQIPNVFLPNDPSSPSFSAVSAFSLNLSGNLTVNGSTTVVGNLASGTLNLSNQSTPPGAAGSGTVNLYTKTADKRLYYKDDAGVESGPLLPGAQTNVTNTFTAPQNFDADACFKGPNPFACVTRYGVRAVNPNTTPAAVGLTANCNSVTNPTQVTISSASTFVNGDGVVLYGCGAPHSMTTPSTPTVTPSLAEAHAGTGLVVNDASGATTYNYRIIARDAAGGLTAASAVGSTTTGASSLGPQTYTISSATVSNQTVTVTTTANHNLPVGCTSPCNIMTSISGTSDDGDYGGWQMIDSVPSSTTFTYSTNPDTRNGAPTSFTGGSGTYWRANHLTWSAVTGAFEYYIYGRTGSSLTLISVSKPQGPNVTDLTFDDFGSPMMDGAALPAYVPTTPPGTATSDNLVTTISSGAGTTTLTLANAAGTTVTGATIRFDNAPNILTAANATISSGGTLTFSAPAPGLSYVVNSYLTLPANLKILQLGPLTLNDTMQLGVNTTWRGDVLDQPVGAPSFAWQTGASITVNTANPGIFSVNASSSAYYGLQLSAAAANASNLWIVDQGNQVTFNNISFVSGFGNGDYMSSGLIMRGVAGVNDPFELYYDRVNFLTGNGLGMPPFYCHFCGINTFYSVQLAHRGMFWYADPNVGMTTDIRQGYAQGIVTPFVSMAASSNVGGGATIQSITEDTAAVPTFSFIGPSANPPSLIYRGVGGSSSGMASVSGRPLASFNAYNQFFPNLTFQNTATLATGIAYDGLFFPAIAGNYASQQLNAAIAAGTAYPIFINGAVPAQPTCSVSTGGSAPIGNLTYRISPVWQNVGEGVYSPASATCTTTTGNQTVTINWTAVLGNPKGYDIYENGARINTGTCSIPQVTGTSFVRSSSAGCGNGAATVPAGGPTMLMPGTQGIATPALTFAGSSISPPASGFTATRNISFPDNSGIIPVTSYQNSAYDNATRANGAIGSNWTVTNNGINIASNNFVGTATNANDVAYWSVNTFSAAQFSQVTLTALNGTTDFPGVAVLLSGSWSATHGYNCVEDTTNIFIQRISGASDTTLTSAATTGVPGDLLRLEVDSAGNLTCYKNAVSTLAVNDTTYTSGSPGLFLFGTVATSKNWSGGNLRPLTQLDTEQDWTKTQHFTQGIALGGAASESFNNNPRSEQNVFLPGALTSTWTGSTWTTDRAVTITRVQVQAKTAPSGCSTNAVVRLTDGTTPVNVTISAASNDSGAIAQNYAGGASLTVAVQTAAAGCTTSPADGNVTVQYRMQ